MQCFVHALIDSDDSFVVGCRQPGSVEVASQPGYVELIEPIAKPCSSPPKIAQLHITGLGCIFPILLHAIQSQLPLLQSRVETTMGGRVCKRQPVHDHHPQVTCTAT